MERQRPGFAGSTVKKGLIFRGFHVAVFWAYGQICYRVIAI